VVIRAALSVARWKLVLAHHSSAVGDPLGVVSCLTSARGLAAARRTTRTTVDCGDVRQMPRASGRLDRCWPARSRTPSAAALTWTCGSPRPPPSRRSRGLRHPQQPTPWPHPRDPNRRAGARPPTPQSPPGSSGGARGARAVVATGPTRSRSGRGCPTHSVGACSTGAAPVPCIGTSTTSPLTASPSPWNAWGAGVADDVALAQDDAQGR
jgi:hypothetical protein